jgi:4-hydroxythreonine-4-phosphate dehydrogenase
MIDPRPLLALTLGDPAGIGPEIAAAALRDPRVRDAARLVLLGPACARPDGLATLDDPSQASLAAVDAPAFVDTGGSARWEVGRAQAASGAAALAALRLGHELATDGLVDALVTGPVSKEALHLAGERVEGQTQLLGRWAGVPDVDMLAVAHELRVLVLTRHLPLRTALDSITTERVRAGIRRLDDGLRRLGIAQPRIAVAGLNPHAGEGGLFGDDEERVLAPAVRAERAAGADVVGPESPDTVFVRAAAGAYDGVLALYHDQAFLPVKIHAPGAGLTILLGLPYLRVSGAHGTAFDIAGRGVAAPGNLIAALLAAARYSTRACSSA